MTRSKITKKVLLEALRSCLAAGEITATVRELAAVDVAKPTSPSHPKYLPTPGEIAAACKRIRAGWSESERRRRAKELTDSDCDRPLSLSSRRARLSKFPRVWCIRCREPFTSSHCVLCELRDAKAMDEAEGRRAAVERIAAAFGAVFAENDAEAAAKERHERRCIARAAGRARRIKAERERLELEAIAERNRRERIARQVESVKPLQAHGPQWRGEPTIVFRGPKVASPSWRAA